MADVDYVRGGIFMKKVGILTLLLVCLVLAAGTSAQAATISGDYLETRNADVYTGYCVANSEVGLVGDQAVMVWHVKEGSWKGVQLDGLSVIGVAKAKATLGDPFANPYPASAVLIVDIRANAEQRRALQEFAQSRSPDLLKDIVRLEVAPIQMEIGEGSQHGCAKLSAGALVKIETRCLGGKDHLCGNEALYYQPLTELSHAMPVFTLDDEFRGSGLGVNWRINNKSSAFIGTFAQETSIAMK
jgi:hypothetical protein